MAQELLLAEERGAAPTGSRGGGARADIDGHQLQLVTGCACHLHESAQTTLCSVEMQTHEEFSRGVRECGQGTVGLDIQHAHGLVPCLCVQQVVVGVHSVSEAVVGGGEVAVSAVAGPVGQSGHQLAVRVEELQCFLHDHIRARGVVKLNSVPANDVAVSIEGGPCRRSVGVRNFSQ